MGKTAAELTPREVRRYRDPARRKEAAETKSMLARRERALRVAREAVRVLKESFGVRPFAPQGFGRPTMGIYRLLGTIAIWHHIGGGTGCNRGQVRRVDAKPSGGTIH